MRTRLAVALLALFALTAFAPAPFPRSARRGNSQTISLDALQGTWRVTVTELSTPGAPGQYAPYKSTLTHIRITGDQWEFLSGGILINRFTIAIDGTKKPAQLNFHPKEGESRPITGAGLIRRLGSKTQILYTWGNKSVRARSFEAPPNGHWLLTLER